MKNKKAYFDFTLLFIILFLLGFGLLMVYSSSAYSASLEESKDSFYYLKHQGFAAIIGIIAMLIVRKIPYELYQKLAIPAFVVGIALICLVLTPLKYEVNGAARWFIIFGVSVQPAEIVKICTIIVTGSLLSFMNEKRRTEWPGIFIALSPALVYALMLLIITNNFSSALIVGGIAFAMVCVSARKNLRPFILLFAVLIVAVLIVILIAKGKIGAHSFRFERIQAWLNPEAYSEGKGYQVLQSLYSVGSGGVWGKGLGNSVQKLGKITEAKNDMIFSIICEELGLFGALLVILMYIIMLWRLRDSARFCSDFFGNMIITGVFTHIALQVLINIAVVTNTIPNTGVSLPFISYGGSSVLFTLIEFGMAMNVTSRSDFSLPYQEISEDENPKVRKEHKGNRE